MTNNHKNHDEKPLQSSEETVEQTRASSHDAEAKSDAQASKKRTSKDKNKSSEDSKAEEKVEIAQFIAEKSQKISRRTETLANGFLRVIRWLSNAFDRVLFNPRHGKLVAFGVALLVFIAFNAVDSNVTPLQDARRSEGVAVAANFNSEMYEVTGYDDKVNVTFLGSAGELTLMNPESKEMKVVLDLSGLTEGTHNVKYTIEGVSSRIRTIIEPASANVTIRTKDAAKVALGYDFINQDKLAPQFVLGTPELETREVSIKASRETIEQVAFVKALIDVSGQTETFETEAQIFAYNQNGEKLQQVDIIPKTVKAKVGISSPYKTVPIKPIFDGEFPEGKAISNYTMDAETIMIYAPQSVLDNIDEINFPVSTSLLTSDKTKLQQAIKLPTGVRHGTVSKVNLEVSLGVASSKKFDKVFIDFANNVNGLKASVDEKGDASTSLTVYGTEENLNNFKIESIQAYIDLRDVKPGENQELPLFIENRDAKGALFKIESDKASIIVDILK